MAPDGQTPDGSSGEAACIFCLPLSAGACNAPPMATVVVVLAAASTVTLPARRAGWALAETRYWPARPRAPPGLG